MGCGSTALMLLRLLSHIPSSAVQPLRPCNVGCLAVTAQNAHVVSHIAGWLLQTLVKRAKHGDDGMDIDRAMMSNIAKRVRFKETDLDPDAEYDYDAGVDL